jgi:SAM-dependent methyltransferase
MGKGVTCSEESAIGRQLNDWYGQPLGRMLAAAEQAALDAVLPNIFGYHLLQAGHAVSPLYGASRILHRAVMASATDVGGPETAVYGDLDALPVVADSLDALILHHALEFAADPRQVLREAERVLVAEGQLVLVGFNPYSLWGLWRRLRLRRRSVPWCGRFIGLPRIKDWLSLLGFEVVQVRHVFFRPPLGRMALQTRLSLIESWGARWWPVLGGVYVISARKKAMTLTPIKPRWRPRRARVGLADPAARSRT